MTAHVKRFFPYLRFLRPVWLQLAGGILCGMLYGSATGAGLPFMIKKVFPTIFGTGAEDLPAWKIVAAALWLPLIFTIRGLTGYLNAYLVQSAGVRVLEAIRLEFFGKLQALPLEFFGRNTTGDLISRGLGDTNQLQNTLTVVSNEIIKQPFTLISAVGYLAYLAYHERGVLLALMCMAVIPLCVFPIRYVGKKMQQKSQQLQGQAGSVTDRFTENLSALREVRAFGLEAMEVGRFEQVSESMVRAQLKVAKYAQMLSPAIEIISALGISATFIYAYRMHVPLESFLAIIVVMYSGYDPIKRLGALTNELKRGEVSLQRLEEVLNAPVAIADPANPVAVSRLRGDIAFHGVNFGYHPDKPVLRGVSIDIPAGTTCALVGPSGAGKSTFAALVPRFYDVNGGSITIDGIDLRAMRVADLRRNIAIVSQDPVLFNDSIYNNLRFGRLDANAEEIQQAARDAFAHEFILSLPEGYDTLVGERGGKLSGGQKQRIAIARAFLRQAPILILDEATSALDSESEAFVQLALRKLIQNKTVLIIAHRFSTIRDASMILVFHDSTIVAHGSHNSLYNSNALYKSLFDRQLTAA